jgi:hypothetical protein
MRGVISQIGTDLPADRHQRRTTLSYLMIGITTLGESHSSSQILLQILSFGGANIAKWSAQGFEVSFSRS